MKRKDSLIGWAFVLSLIMILLVVGDYLALHDIRSDYVSSGVLENFPDFDSGNIPDWAATRMEWIFVWISLFLKIIILPVILVALGKAVRRLRL